MESLGDYGEWVAAGCVGCERRCDWYGWGYDRWRRLVYVRDGRGLRGLWSGSFCSAMTRAASRRLVRIGG